MSIVSGAALYGSRYLPDYYRPIDRILGSAGKTRRKTGSGSESLQGSKRFASAASMRPPWEKSISDIFGASAEYMADPVKSYNSVYKALDDKDLGQTYGELKKDSGYFHLDKRQGLSYTTKPRERTLNWARDITAADRPTSNRDTVFTGYRAPPPQETFSQLKSPHRETFSQRLFYRPVNLDEH